MQQIIYVFDGFRLDVARRRLCSSGGVVVPLSARAMDALHLLVANAGQVLEKRRLMEAVWPTAVVEDNNLNQCILTIRRALGESAGTNRYVMTVPGRGYCFVCPVNTQTAESNAEDTRTPRVSRAAWIRLGVVGALGAASLLLVSGRHLHVEVRLVGNDSPIPPRTERSGPEAGRLLPRQQGAAGSHDACGQQISKK
jgi:DNA-binding winged helix-turn-helix (wHTH) protein